MWIINLIFRKFIYKIYVSIDIEEGSILKKYLEAARSLSPEERGKLLENDASFTGAHQELAIEGQTDAASEPVIHHYVVLVNFNNELYELNGNKLCPISHGPTTDDSFLLVIIPNLEQSFLLYINKSIKM